MDYNDIGTCDNEAFWYDKGAGRRKMAKLAEVRVTDPVTGGQKGTKLARFDLIPPEALWGLAEVYGKGCEKYADRNWERGYKWGLSVAALERHLNLWKRGESIDPETGCYHLLQVAWHAFALFTFQLRGLGVDDLRPKASSSVAVSDSQQLSLLLQDSSG